VKIIFLNSLTQTDRHILIKLNHDLLGRTVEFHISIKWLVVRILFNEPRHYTTSLTHSLTHWTAWRAVCRIALSTYHCLQQQSRRVCRYFRVKLYLADPRVSMATALSPQANVTQGHSEDALCVIFKVSIIGACRMQTDRSTNKQTDKQTDRRSLRLYAKNWRTYNTQFDISCIWDRTQQRFSFANQTKTTTKSLWFSQPNRVRIAVHKLIPHCPISPIIECLSLLFALTREYCSSECWQRWVCKRACGFQQILRDRPSAQRTARTQQVAYSQDDLRYVGGPGRARITVSLLPQLHVHDLQPSRSRVTRDLHGQIRRNHRSRSFPARILPVPLRRRLSRSSRTDRGHLSTHRRGTPQSTRWHAEWDASC